MKSTEVVKMVNSDNSSSLNLVLDKRTKVVL